jgi:hypothetical protein
VATVRSTAQHASATAHEQRLLDDIREEPQRKALENRLRVAFLATRGHTMPMWLAQRPTILATALTGPTHPAAS